MKLKFKNIVRENSPKLPQMENGQFQLELVASD